MGLGAGDLLLQDRGDERTRRRPRCAGCARRDAGGPGRRSGRGRPWRAPRSAASRAPRPTSRPARSRASSAPAPHASAVRAPAATDRRRVAGPSAVRVVHHASSRGHPDGPIAVAADERGQGAAGGRGALERAARAGSSTESGMVSKWPRPGRAIPGSRGSMVRLAGRATPQGRRDRCAHRRARHGRRPRTGGFAGPKPAPDPRRRSLRYGGDRVCPRAGDDDTAPRSGGPFRREPGRKLDPVRARSQRTSRHRLGPRLPSPRRRPGRS